METTKDKDLIQKSKCTHIRIRGSSDYYINVESTIKSIEKQYQIDFRSLPQWQDLVKKFHLAETICKRRIQNANLQKATIVEKLYTQSNRLSPFELTELLARTADKWRALKSGRKPSLSPHEVPSVQEVKDFFEEDIVNEESETPHHNTRTSLIDNVAATKTNVDLQLSSLSDTHTTNLPIFITTNTHHLISPYDSEISRLSYHSILDHTEHRGVEYVNEVQPSTSAVISNPKILNIVKNTLKQQTLHFSLTNCTSEYLHVKFVNISNHSPFKYTKIYPIIPKRLYPGIAIVFKFVFKLQNLDEFKSGFYFRIGRDVYANAPTELFFIPILRSFSIIPLVTISEIVTIPPAYPWHIKTAPESEYPTGIVKICNDEPFSYHLHIRKREVDLISEHETSMTLTSKATKNFQNCDSLFQSTFIEQSHSVKNDLVLQDSNISNVEINNLISDIVYDIVGLALNAFLFDSTYIYLQSHSRRSISVYFIEPEYTGYHNSYYDFELIDPESETVAMTKTIKVFAEALPHPIQVTPKILDMSKSPCVHGYYEDHFTISNTHKVFQAIIYINLTTKMKKIFNVVPMKTTIPPQASVQFDVKFCSRDSMSISTSEYLVHFTFKITVVGFKPMYKNIPPIFYEIIVPCEYEFKRVYPGKYYQEI